MLDDFQVGQQVLVGGLHGSPQPGSIHAHGNLALGKQGADVTGSFVHGGQLFLEHGLPAGEAFGHLGGVDGDFAVLIGEARAGIQDEGVDLGQVLAAGGGLETDTELIDNAVFVGVNRQFAGGLEEGLVIGRDGNAGVFEDFFIDGQDVAEVLRHNADILALPDAYALAGPILDRQVAFLNPGTQIFQPAFFGQGLIFEGGHVGDFGRVSTGKLGHHRVGVLGTGDLGEFNFHIRVGFFELGNDIFPPCTDGFINLP